MTLTNRIRTFKTWWAMTSVVVRSILTGGIMFTWTVATMAYIFRAVFADKTFWAPTLVTIDKIDADSLIRALHMQTVVNVLLTILTFKT